MKARLALIWAGIMAAGVTVVGVLTGRRRKARAQRQKARDQRRAKKAQRRAQGGGARPSATPTRPSTAETPVPTAAPEPSASEAAGTPEATGDDLRAIKGLGAVAAEKLTAAGVTTYAQIAAWTPEEARDLALHLELQPGRIASDDWVGQARELLDKREAGAPTA